MGNISTSHQGLTNYARQIEYIHLLFESPMEKKEEEKEDITLNIMLSRRYYALFTCVLCRHMPSSSDIVLRRQ